MPNFLISLLITVWIIGVGILSVQNATLVSLKFLSLRSIELPIGMVLAFSAALGLIGAALMQVVWQLPSEKLPTRKPVQRDQ